MGLLDVLNGMQNGPRGQRDPTASSQGMSPLTMAVLGLLAYKAIKSFTGNQPSAETVGTPPSTQPASRLGGPTNAGMSGGGLGDLLSSGLGGLSRAALPEAFSWWLKRAAQAIPAKRAWRRRKVVGWHWAEQEHFAERFGENTRVRSARHANDANRDVARRTDSRS